MPKEVTQILVGIALAALSGVGSIAIYYLQLSSKLAKAKIAAHFNQEDSRIANLLIDAGENCIRTSVVQTNQTIVDNLKAKSTDGKLTAQEAKDIFSIAFDTATKLMGATLVTKLKELVPDFQLWMTSKIEYYVSQNHK